MRHLTAIAVRSLTSSTKCRASRLARAEKRGILVNAIYCTTNSVWSAREFDAVGCVTSIFCCPLWVAQAISEVAFADEIGLSGLSSILCRRSAPAHTTKSELADIVHTLYLPKTSRWHSS